MLHIRL